MDDWIENAELILSSARAVVPADGGLERVRGLRFDTPGWDRAMMRQIAQMGFLLMRVEAARGGLGLGLRETCAVLRLFGRGLVPEPVISSMLACALLQDRLPEAVISGQAVLVTAWQDRPNALDHAGGVEGGLLQGRKVHVPGAAGADLFAVLSAQGVAIVPRDASGLDLRTQALLDGGHSGQLTLAGIAAEIIPTPQAGQAIDEAILLQSAYLLGLSEKALELTLDYLRVRQQFGRAIGSFQALQHRATEMKIQSELLRAAIFATARRIDQGADQGDDGRHRAQAVSRCKARAADLAMLVAGEAVQMHGAMGITDEADIGLFVRRAMTEANQFGAARVHRARLGAQLEEIAA